MTQPRVMRWHVVSTGGEFPPAGGCLALAHGANRRFEQIDVARDAVRFVDRSLGRSLGRGLDRSLGRSLGRGIRAARRADQAIGAARRSGWHVK
jgi:hypothetical protein